MDGKLIPSIIIIGLLIAGGAYFFWREAEAPSPVVSSFEECAAAGYPIMESYPEQCRTPDGKTFVRDIGNELAKHDLIRIAFPRPGGKVTSPLSLSGEARGTWYFEASFPVELRDASGNVLAEHYAEAQSEWMTTEFVPFKSTLIFPTQPAGSKGTLMLRKDNPSGLPEHDDQLFIPVIF